MGLPPPNVDLPKWENKRKLVVQFDYLCLCCLLPVRLFYTTTATCLRLFDSSGSFGTFLYSFAFDFDAMGLHDDGGRFKGLSFCLSNAGTFVCVFLNISVPYPAHRTTMTTAGRKWVVAGVAASLSSLVPVCWVLSLSLSVAPWRAFSDLKLAI